MAFILENVSVAGLHLQFKSKQRLLDGIYVQPLLITCNLSLVNFSKILPTTYDASY